MDVERVGEQFGGAERQAGVADGATWSRALAAFLFAEKDTLTAGDLADELGVSAGSVSVRSGCSRRWA
ncbi:helix-turn-helix domain-containing protein [Lentzea californiensis]|uniref:helix-turn-helix domain-containing protein n=1 Tax=Lentzea californiensis TaxID=438851 RepID=UPI0021645B07|nr:helix-turn-helix domain-containing protein [Lentzea californiensis]